MKQLLILILTITLLYGCNSNKNESVIIPPEIKQGIDENFNIKGFNNGVTIHLNTDFTFINNCYAYGCMGGYRLKLVFGDYSIDDNKITFNPKQLVWKEDWSSYRPDTTLMFDTIPYYESDSTSIQKEYCLVENKDIKFLVSQTELYQQDEYYYYSSNFIALSNMYNSGIKQFTNKYLLSNVDTLWDFKNLNLAENIPNSQLKYFYDSAITAKVISSKVTKDEQELIPNYKLKIIGERKLEIGAKLYSNEFPNNPITVSKFDGDNYFAQGYSLFNENTKLKNGTIISTECPEEIYEIE